MIQSHLNAIDDDADDDDDDDDVADCPFSDLAIVGHDNHATSPKKMRWCHSVLGWLCAKFKYRCDAYHLDHWMKLHLFAHMSVYVYVLSLHRHLSSTLLAESVRPLYKMSYWLLFVSMRF